jgi:hypothetical protein
MKRKARPWLSYANVMSTLCLFVLLGGGAYAASKIDGSQLKKRSVSGKKLKTETVTQKEIKPSTLAKFMRQEINYVFEDGPVNAGAGNGVP